MLEELSLYDNLGTPSYFFELFVKARTTSHSIFTQKNLIDHFYNRMIDGRGVFDGCVPLLKIIGIAQVDAYGNISVDSSFLIEHLNLIWMTDKILEKLFFSLVLDKVFQDIFCPKFISFDIMNNSIQIDNSAFPFKYSNFKQLLIDFGILQIHPLVEVNKFVLNKRHKRLFDKVILPTIKKKKLGLDDLDAFMQQSKVVGEEAERFVLKYENERLYGKVNIVWVAEYSITDGYDIASYDTEHSNTHDRFIEVKSYVNEVSFFWSRNEMDIARIKNDNYYLYLVDRGKMKAKGYKPIIIQNPYKNVFKNQIDWQQRIEKIRFNKN